MESFDFVIVGSGFGGCMLAYELVNSGFRVAMLERGQWVKRRPENWSRWGSIDLTPHYDKSLPYDVVKGGNKKKMGIYAAVGGPSVFYGGVSFRFREQDFYPEKELIGNSGAAWPIDYQDLKPYYEEAEALLQVSGESGIDPTEPPRNRAFPQDKPPLAAISQKIKTAAQQLGLNPFSLPLAINYENTQRQLCQQCTTCDTYACAVSAKNDLATVMIPDLLAKGMVLFPETVANQLVYKNGKIDHLKAYNIAKNENILLKSNAYILSAGALASPHIVLNSDLAKYNPGGKNVGRYLMRHVNAIVFGIFSSRADKEQRFHKQLAILDYYFKHPDYKELSKIGSLQQVPTPPAGLVQNEIPGFVGNWLSKGVKLLTGLLAIAEDQPNFDNGIQLANNGVKKHGLMQAQVSHTYSERDKKAIGILTKEAKKIMSKTGALTHYTHHIKTFSHAVGTMRMGNVAEASVLDKYGNFRGIDNLYVVDASFMPTSAAVNPSLTISANALRIGRHLAENFV